MSVEERPLGSRSTDEVRVIKGPIAPPDGRPIQIFGYRPICSVYLESGIVVTNPELFPVEWLYYAPTTVE